MCVLQETTEPIQSCSGTLNVHYAAPSTSHAVASTITAQRRPSNKRPAVYNFVSSDDSDSSDTEPASHKRRKVTSASTKIVVKGRKGKLSAKTNPVAEKLLRPAPLPLKHALQTKASKNLTSEDIDVIDKDSGSSRDQVLDVVRKVHGVLRRVPASYRAAMTERASNKKKCLVCCEEFSDTNPPLIQSCKSVRRQISSSKSTCPFIYICKDCLQDVCTVTVTASQDRKTYPATVTKLKSIVCGHLLDEDVVLRTPLEEAKKISKKQKHGFYGMFIHAWNAIMNARAADDPENDPEDGIKSTFGSDRSRSKTTKVLHKCCSILGLQINKSLHKAFHKSAGKKKARKSKTATQQSTSTEAAQDAYKQHAPEQNHNLQAPQNQLVSQQNVQSPYEQLTPSPAITLETATSVAAQISLPNQAQNQENSLSVAQCSQRFAGQQQLQSFGNNLLDNLENIQLGYSTSPAEAYRDVTLSSTVSSNSHAAVAGLQQRIAFTPVLSNQLASVMENAGILVSTSAVNTSASSSTTGTSTVLAQDDNIFAILKEQVPGAFR